MDLGAVFSRLGYLASRRQLESLGMSRHSINRAIRVGIVLPVRPGWVAMPSANQVGVTAVLHGGQLTGATALRSYGVWAGSDMRIRVQVPPGSHRVTHRAVTSVDEFAEPRFSYGDVVLEWATADIQPVTAPQWRVSASDALVRFARQESAEQVAAAIESLVHEKRMSRRAAADLQYRLPRRLRRMFARLTFQAESGLETIGRLRLEDVGYLVQQQVEIGPDRVDLVIDGWLIIEWDGDEWHDPKKDRLRTNRLVRAGYTVLRFGYADVMFSWDRTMETIRAAEQQVLTSPVGFIDSTRF